jgi:hypothetical protein
MAAVAVSRYRRRLSSLDRHHSAPRPSGVFMPTDTARAKLRVRADHCWRSKPTFPPIIISGFARGLIANPDYLRDKGNGCINAMKCHYYSRLLAGETLLTCGRRDKLSTSRIAE